MRVGLHTGEPTLALVGSTLPPGVSLFPLGERHLKDIDEPERVYELEIEGVKPPPAPTVEAPERVSPSERKARQKQWETQGRGVDAIAVNAGELMKLIEGEIRRARDDPPGGGGG